MGAAQKKRLLAAQERFRRQNFFYIYAYQGLCMMHIEKRIPNHQRIWK